MGSTPDFSSLFRSTVGVDEDWSGHLPYDIEKIGEDTYQLTMAVAGFGQNDLRVETRENTLILTGKTEAKDAEQVWLHRAIDGRSSQLAGFTKVTGADLENGLRHIDLVCEVPEVMKPRRIEIETPARETIVPKTKKLVEGKNLAARHVGTRRRRNPPAPIILVKVIGGVNAHGARNRVH